MSDFPIQATIKPPALISNAPWLNFQAEDQATLESQIKEAFPTVEADSLSELVAKAYLEYGAVLTASLGLAAPAAPQAASIQSPGPAPQWAAPAAPAAAPGPQCRHGEMSYKSGFTNKPGTPNHGKEWKGWFCAAPQGTPDNQKCPKQWVH